MPTRGQFQEALEMLRVDVDALGLMAERAVTGALRAQPCAARPRGGPNLERIADHAVIIGERVSYMLTGNPGALAAEIR